jgi:hypothetical protein
MSLLHPDDFDYAMAEGHANAGWNKAVRRCMRLRALLEKAKSIVAGFEDPSYSLAREIDEALSETFYDESDKEPENWTDKT